ncbi:MAG: hypothetical protein WC308_02535 [archaeon]|jgi:rRNA-processing protein FCF1
MERSCKVLLDTNFLLGAVKLKISVFDEIREKPGCEKVGFFVTTGILEELKKLSAKKTLAKDGKIVVKMIEKNGVKVVKAKGTVDDTLVEMSKDYWVATNDSALRKKIKSFGGRTIYIRKRAFVEVDGA